MSTEQGKKKSLKAQKAARSQAKTKEGPVASERTMKEVSNSILSASLLSFGTVIRRVIC